MTDHKRVISTMTSTTASDFRKYGLQWCNVGWNDCTRASGSTLGSNISDWSFRLKSGETLPFLRRPNFEDKTVTVRAKDVAIVVDSPSGHVKAVTFQHYLENFGMYTPGIPDRIQMHNSDSDNEFITVRNIAVVVPEDMSGSQEVVPTCYSYGTLNKTDPQNILGASFHMGVGTRPSGVRQEKVFLVKPSSHCSSEVTMDGFPRQLSKEIHDKMVESKQHTTFAEFIRAINQSGSFIDTCHRNGVTAPTDIVAVAHVLSNSKTKWLDDSGEFSEAFMAWVSDFSRQSIDYDSSKGNEYDNTWFRITNESHETEEQKKSVGTVLGTRSNGTGRNRVQCFQIPRQQKPVYRSMNKPKGNLVPKGLFSMSTGNVSFGSNAGKLQTDNNISYTRDNQQHVTMTFAYYFTTKDGNLSAEDIKTIADTLESGYREIKAEWVGSLVTGKKDPSISSKCTDAPIVLPECTQADYMQFNQKVTAFPRALTDVTVFPE